MVESPAPRSSFLIWYVITTPTLHHNGIFFWKKPRAWFISLDISSSLICLQRDLPGDFIVRASVTRGPERSIAVLRARKDPEAWEHSSELFRIPQNLTQTSQSEKQDANIQGQLLRWVEHNRHPKKVGHTLWLPSRKTVWKELESDHTVEGLGNTGDQGEHWEGKCPWRWEAGLALTPRRR